MTRFGMSMMRLIGAVMAVALLVSVAPVLAGDSFYALSRLAGLTPLDDAQLATVEGGQVNQSIVVYENTQEVHQSMIIGNIDPDTTVAVSLEEVAPVQAFVEGWLQAIFQGEVAPVQAFVEGWLQR